jgi:cation diffusion facilitator CzcD-associated flavoprotein CzcO
LTDLLVIGAGPYGLACAHAARRAGLDVEIVGRPMSFWREHMPAGMFLRSGPDWHFDVAGELTFTAFAGERIADPIPIADYLAYADWFAEQAGIEVRDEVVVELAPGPPLLATLASGGAIAARAVVAAPGIARLAAVPDWGAGLGVHTCELVDFADLRGARVLIVGGRQSAYEWAALIGEAGAERIDVVHRHPRPCFEDVSWAFADAHLDSTLATDGWWRRLPPADRDAIGRRFWEVGRLTLEDWLVPRLDAAPLHVHENAEVLAVDGLPVAAGAAASPGAAPGASRRIALSDGAELDVDRIVFATGYRADVAAVPYLPPVASTDGFPDLNESFGSSIPGLYIPGFLATRDFGPFFGFVRGAVPAAAIIARDLMRRRA